MAMQKSLGGEITPGHANGRKNGLTATDRSGLVHPYLMERKTKMMKMNEKIQEQKTQGISSKVDPT